MEANQTDIIARRFLRTGSIAGSSEKEVALACERLIQGVFRASIRKALGVAERFFERAEAHGGKTLIQTACRSLGRMHHFSGAHRFALRYYLRARTLCRDEKLIRGRIDRTLIDIYMYLGDMKAAMRSGRNALRTFTALDAQSDLAQTRVNLGNLYHRQDQPEQADLLYRDAISFFETTDNKLALARCYYNRANVLVQLFQMETAEAVYNRSLAIYNESGYELDACDVRYGLAWLWLLTGHFHKALLELSACEGVYRKAGDPRGFALCSLDRAEVYLQLGLYREAFETARSARKRFASLGLTYEQGKASLYAAYALAGLRFPARARKELAVAEKFFAPLHHDGYLGAARMLQVDLDERGIKARLQDLRRSRRQFTRAHLPFWDALCDIKSAELTGRAAAVLPHLRRNPAVRCVPHLFAAWQVLEGDAAAADGHRDKALAAWRKAADRLDTVRAALPPMEMRTRYTRVTRLPHTRLIEAYLPQEPMLAAVWSERSRTAGIWDTGAPSAELMQIRQNVARSLDALSAHVLSLSKELVSPSHRSAGSSSAAASHTRIAYLHRRVRECLLEIDSKGTPGILDAEEFTARTRTESAEAPIVQFHIAPRDIYALVHDHGTVTARRFPRGVQRLEQLNERWRFCLERELLQSAGKRRPDDLERSVWREFGDWLWAGLELPAAAEQVVIVPDGVLANIPWQAVEYNGTRVGDRHHVILAPSLRHHWLARNSTPTGNEIHLFRGQADSLPAVDAELARLQDVCPGRTILHNPADRASWPAEGDHLAWHYAGHAHLAGDNPFYSYLMLPDGPLFAADFQLRRCRVGLVTLAACRSGEEVALPGEESTGFVRAMLEMGARNVLAGRWPVSDQSTALFMDHFYSELLNRRSLAESLRRAEQQTRETFPSAYHWAAFGLYGAGTLGG